MSLCIPEIKDLYRIRKEDVAEFADCASKAYEGYPLCREMFGNEYRKDIMGDILKIRFENYPKNVVALSTDENMHAVSVFVPPGMKGPGPLEYLRSGGVKVLKKIGADKLRFLLKYRIYETGRRKEYSDRNDWYLEELHVDPSHRGKGLASEILRPMLEYFDRIGKNCYLETHKEVNVDIYEHFGFELVGTGTVPGTELDHYSMLRKPL